MHDFGQNFRTETVNNGVHVVTWDMPGRSMNVVDGAVLDDLEALKTVRCFAEGVLATCKAHADELGRHYRPPALLLDMAKSAMGAGEGFYRRIPPAAA